MITRPAFKRALGIATGDIVRTSYGTGPYEVWDIWGPHSWHEDSLSITIWPQPIISLSLATMTETGEMIVPRNGDFCGINEIWRDGDRWFRGTDEVFVESGSSSIQGSLFDQEPEAPTYQFQPGVDYHHPRLWHCPRCKRDFDDSQLSEPPIEVTTYSKLVYGPNKMVRPYCPHCGGWPKPIHFVQPGMNSYLMRISR